MRTPSRLTENPLIEFHKNQTAILRWSLVTGVLKSHLKLVRFYHPAKKDVIALSLCKDKSFQGLFALHILE